MKVNEEKNTLAETQDRKTEPGFTPGPWKIETPRDRDEEDADWYESYPRGVTVRAEWGKPRKDGALGYEICRMSGVHEHTLLDARLIAAAPELYEALHEVKRVLEAPTTTASMPHTHKKVCAALALVDGPQNQEAK